jgi:sulfoxide reductase heme-binding subunit YedZ
VVLKPVVFVLALLPLARIVYMVAAGQVVEPLEFITRGTGDWTLYLLCMTLAVTPLRKLSGWNALARLRRMLGLFTFFYALLHFTAFLWFDHFFDVGAMLADVVKRPFITVGFLAFVLLVPLAATSTNAMVRRLGGKRWSLLHKLVYVIAPLGILHFWWMKAGKSDFAEPAAMGIVVAVLLGLRLLWRLRARAAG